MSDSDTPKSEGHPGENPMPAAKEEGHPESEGENPMPAAKEEGHPESEGENPMSVVKEEGHPESEGENPMPAAKEEGHPESAPPKSARPQGSEPTRRTRRESSAPASPVPRGPVRFPEAVEKARLRMTESARLAALEKAMKAEKEANPARYFRNLLEPHLRLEEEDEEDSPRYTGSDDFSDCSPSAHKRQRDGRSRSPAGERCDQRRIVKRENETAKTDDQLEKEDATNMTDDQLEKEDATNMIDDASKIFAQVKTSPPGSDDPRPESTGGDVYVAPPQADAGMEDAAGAS